MQIGGVEQKDKDLHKHIDDQIRGQGQHMVVKIAALHHGCHNHLIKDKGGKSINDSG